MESVNKIALIVHTTSSATDKNGNRYHWCLFTFTATGERLLVGGMGGDSNGQHLAHKLGLEWAQIYNASTTLPIRRWDSINDSRPNDCWEHEALPRLEAMLESTEVGAA